MAQQAADDWNANLGLVQFATQVDDGAVAKQRDGMNTVAFSDTIYGDTFGDETIAVTLLNYAHIVDLVETDVLVNSADTFDSYTGPLRDPGQPTNIDLHRVLLHEFGHVLGLAHPDAIGQTVTAVMNSVVSNTDELTADDIGGTTIIYGDTALKSLPLTPVGLAVDDRRGKIYATTAKANGKGSLLVIDPYGPEVVATVHAGSKPKVLALSGDDEFLYMGVDGKGVIDQIDPDTLTQTLEFPLGAQAGVTAAHILVLPGQPGSVLVSQVGNIDNSSGYTGVSDSADFAIYDQGVLRTGEAFDPFDTPGSPVVLNSDGQTGYAVSGGSPHLLTISANGITYPSSNYFMVALGNTGSQPAYDQPLLFDIDGTVVDLVDSVQATPFAGIAEYGNYALALDPGQGRVFFAVPNSNNLALANAPGANVSVLSEQTSVLVGDIATRAFLPAITLPRYTEVTNLSRWGTNGLIITIEDTRSLYSEHTLLIRSNLIGPGPVSGEPPTVSVGTPKFAVLDENSGVKDKVAVTRVDGDLSAPLTVHYTVSGTAQSGADFRVLSGVITIPTGQSKAKIKVVPLGSQFSDGPRTLQIRLAPDPAYRWGTSSAAAISVTSD